jgi:hypothetical protein
MVAWAWSFAPPLQALSGRCEMGKRGPTCSICKHPRVEEINSKIASQEKLADISREFAVSEDALSRHKDKCIIIALSATPNTKDVINGDNLLKQLQAAREETLKLLDMAIEAGNTKTYGSPSNYLAELRQQIKLWAELDGRLASQPQINLHQINIYESPEWDAVGNMLYRVLAEYPDLKSQVARELLALARGAK